MAPGAVTVYALDGQGWCLRALGRTEEAASVFDEANRRGREMFVTPHLLGWAHLGRALLAAEEGDAEAAQRELREAVRDSSASAAAFAAKAWLAGTKSCSDAHAHFAVSLAIIPWQEQALAGQRLCSQLGDTGRLPNWQEVDGFPGWRPQPTVSIQQWLDPGDTRLVEADLETACAQVRAVGSTLVLLTYPQPDAHPDLAAAILRAGRRCGVPVVDPRARFRSALDDGVPWSELLVADGHPTARGYAMIGELLGETLLEERGVRQ
jgi:tetratricopeptide (TPR) repeat protein